MPLMGHKLYGLTVAYGYFENDNNASISVGVDGNDGDKLKLSASTAVDVNPTTVAQLTIDPAANGNIDLDPNGTGKIDVLSGNINIPTTTTSTNGVIEFGSFRFLHRYGTNNTFCGHTTGNFTLTGIDNTGFGFAALKNLTDGQDNTCMGENAGDAITSGDSNTCIGTRSFNEGTTGNDNTIVGSLTSGNITWNGSRNLVVKQGGSSAGWIQIQYQGTESDNILIGNSGVLGENNKIRIGNTGLGNFQQDQTFIAGIYNTAVGATTQIMRIDSAGQIGSFEGTDGQLIVGSTAGSPAWATLASADGSVTITNGSNTIDLAASGGGLTWSVETDAAVAGAVGTGYIANRAGLVTITLPDTAAVGSIIEVTGINTAVGWRIAQNAGETIYFGTSATTTGVGGYLESTNIRDSVRLVCVVADTDWNVISSVGPTITVV